jgi:N-acetylneuraminic acid mutarotase
LTGLTANSSRVDIYDTLTKQWSIAELSVTTKLGMAVATLGSKIFFAGGAAADLSKLTSGVDIYDAASNMWSTAELSSPRAYLASAVLGSKVFFAGGGDATFYDVDDILALSGSDKVDIYDDNTHLWTTATLSKARYGLSTTVAGSRIFFAGGGYNNDGGAYNDYSLSPNIDIYDAISNTWTTSQLQLSRRDQAGISAGNTIFWMGGYTPISLANNYSLATDFEIRDLSSGVSSLKPSPQSAIAVKIDDRIVCFAGNNNSYSIPDGVADTLNIYNIVSDTWSRSILKYRIRDEAVISVNNEIYIAGGEIDGHVNSLVWKLKLP